MRAYPCPPRPSGGDPVPTLFVKCKSCGTEFPSPIGATGTGDRGLIISGLELHCPACKAAAQYSTAEFHIPAATEASPAGDRSVAVEDIHHEHVAKEEAVQAKLVGLGVVASDGPARAPTRE